MLKLVYLNLIAILLLLSNDLMAGPDRITGIPGTTRSEVIARNGMVATSQPLATQVGLDILKQGGNAIDAAIAANAVIGLMEPTGNGIGGDLFAIVWDNKEKKLYGLNGSGRSPLGLSYDQMKAELEARGISKIPKYGHLPISVPGTVDAWFELHQKFGQLPMDKILSPAIVYGIEGFPVSELIAYYWNLSIEPRKDQPGAFLDTFTINGKAPAKGEIFKNPDLSNTLQLLVDQGRSAFYEGEIADKVDAFMREIGGYLRRDDFINHTSTWVEPLSTNYRGYDVWELPPNGQGIAVLQMLNILENYDLKSMGHNSAEKLHLMVEAKKLVFEDRAKLYVDPDFAKIPLDTILSKEYARERAKLIGERAMRSAEAGASILRDGDTIYLTTADSDGNMVSLIQSNYRGMGSGIVVPGTGFMFQDRGELFSMDPDHANVYEPGKRPFTTIIPAFVTKEGKPYISFGLMGGAMQPQGHVQIITNIIDFGMNLQEAGDAARWQHFGGSEPTDAADAKLTNVGQLSLESGIPYDVVRALMGKGHRVNYARGPYGGYQAIMVDENGTYYGASESRKDGQAAGY
jgi:gamma-glutamyltranspeptidase/glutathione hydrolase